MAAENSPSSKKSEPARPPGGTVPATPAPAPTPTPRPAVLGLQRSRTSIWLAGVCGGLGEETAVPAWVWRAMFLGVPLLLVFFALKLAAVWLCLPVVAYAVIWALTRQAPAAADEPPPMYRRVDWLTCLATTALVFAGYLYTIAPDLTLEDCGELAVGSLYAGVPHPPGYPVWTIYTWLFTELIPFSNIAWRVAVSSAFAAAASCGLIALMVSRGSSMMLEGIGEFKGLDRKAENGICAVAGFVSGALMGFNGFFWSQAVIVEVYTLSVFSLTGVLACLLRWVYAPEQRRFVYWALFLFGICFTNHQTLIVAAVGIETLILARDRRLGRDLFLVNSIIFVLVLALMAAKGGSGGGVNPMILRIFHFVGIGSVIVFAFTAMKPRDNAKWFFAGGYLLLTVTILARWFDKVGQASELAPVLFKFYVFTNWLALAGVVIYCCVSNKQDKVFSNFVPVVIMGGLFAAGASFYLYMPIASMTNPPLNWGYPRTIEGFIHALTRGQYESARPTDDPLKFLGQIQLFTQGAFEEFNPVFLAIGLVPVAFLFYRTPRRDWLTIAAATVLYVGFCFLWIWGDLRPRLAEGTDGQIAEAMLHYISLTPGMIFGYVYVLIAATAVLHFMQGEKVEKAWFTGLAAVFLWLAMILLILLNPQPDRQSLQLNRVFFTSSHVMIAMGIGYGLAIIAGGLVTHYQRVRRWVLVAAAIAAGVALYNVVFTHSDEYELARQSDLLQLFGLEPTSNPVSRLAAWFALALAASAVVVLVLGRQRLLLPALLAVFALLPAKSVLSHWWENEQRGHLFGFWFGHDMFTPPFQGPDGQLTYDRTLREQLLKDPEQSKLIYPEMARDAVLFGGTDPGRFNPTYMIFCESFVDPGDRLNPEFDRRDVYIITQNALADATYLAYIRAHYNRSAQQDAPFFAGAVDYFQNKALAPKQLEKRQRGEPYSLSTTAKLLGAFKPLARPLDNIFTAFGARVEADRRAREVYPPKEILTPTSEDSEKAFNEYVTDAGRRAQLGQLRPGEDVRIDGNRLSVSGQIAVMAINGLLTKVIFDKNPNHEFYVEESFPLDWMYPYLTPFGIIMKINREPLPALSEEIVHRDHHFWSTFSDRLIGSWITYDTPVTNICDFAERVYVRHDLKDFKGDPKFIRDDNAQKAFSKLRSAIGGLYTWRVNHCTTQLQTLFANPNQANFASERDRLLAEQQRMIKEAEFAFRQSFAFCPYSPEAVYRYINLLMSLAPQDPKRLDDAAALVSVARKLDPENLGFRDLELQLEGFRQRAAQPPQAQAQPAPAPPPQQVVQIDALETEYRGNPTNVQLMANLAAGYAQLRRTNDALALVSQYASRSDVDALSLLGAAQVYSSILQHPNEAIALADKIAALPDIDPQTLTSVAHYFGSLQQVTRLENALKRLVALMPASPEAWYDLAAIQAAIGKNPDAAASLQKALELSDQRFAGDTKQRDLRSNATVDARFQLLRQMPEHQHLFQPPR
jgi:tetratricopeptide (TPR) repeat protein/phage shock protein PspC (stress-responsive transcriptional regulator)